MLMLLGTLVYEIGNLLWKLVKNYRIKKECHQWEDKAFEKETKIAFKNLEKLYDKVTKQQQLEKEEGIEVIVNLLEEEEIEQ